MRIFLALLLSTTALPALAQERPVSLVGSGVAASSAQNSATRPIRFAAAAPAGSTLVVPLLRADGVAAATAGLPSATAEAIRAGVAAARFEPKANTTLSLYGVPGHARVLLVGIKPVREVPLEADIANFAGTALQELRGDPAEIAILTAGLPADAAGYAATQAAFGAQLGQYRFDRLKSTSKAPPVAPVTVVTADAGAAARYAADLQHVADATAFARDLVTTPATELYPESFVAEVRAQLRGVPNVRITALDEAQMRSLGMGSLVGVGQGSRRPSRLLAVEYRGGSGAPLALVGKGITFDSGGISIKPALGMWEMKGDMAGAAATMGAVIAAARRGANVNVVAVAALSENMPGGNAQRPGDVVRTMNGKTIEVINTDAEGRLVLADANQWTIRQFQPMALVNIATLTGGIVAALGDEYAGLFAREETLAGRLMTAGGKVGEDLWRMPIHPSYAEDMASEIADIKNANEGGRAGSGTAAHFISYLTPEPTPWAHIDMAAVDRAEKALPTVPKGPRGFGVRLLDQLLRGYESR